MAQVALELLIGRETTPRRDSIATRRRLVDGIGTFAVDNGRPPLRLADVAAHVGVSTATAYRYFGSLDELANAHLARLPARATMLFEKGLFAKGRSGTLGDPASELEAWNRAWVTSCLRFSDSAIPLRSSVGFMRRRADGDALVRYVCDRVEPLLAACGLPIEAALTVWNAISDPREVADLRQTLGWSARRIATHITQVTLAVGDTASPT